MALASGAALAYQILLLRLFSIVQFHHTAYMVISLALLGYGASGTVLTFWRQRWMAGFEAAFAACLALFAITSVACLAVAQRIAVHPEELLWSPPQVGWLLVLYLLLAVPFLFAGAAIGLALIQLPSTRVYAADLTGAGVGSLAAVGLLWWTTPGGVLRFLAMAALAAILVAAWEFGRWSWRRLGSTLALAGLVWAVPADWVEPQPLEFKGLSQMLRIHGARLVEERSNPLAMVSVVESPEVPLRHAPGLSLAVPTEPPEQVGLFLDAEALVPILRRRDGSPRLRFLEYSTQALPYAMAAPDRVLVLGSGGGEEVARALHFDADSVVAVEINPDVVDLMRGRYAEFTGDLYRRPDVEVRIADARGFVERDPRTFDLVVLPLVSGFGGGGPALASLSEDYLLTVEAFDAILNRVSDGGFLSTGVFLENPPRNVVKLAATVIAALERRGVNDPGSRLALIRSWQTATLVVKRGRLTELEIARLSEFANRRLFDVVHVPEMEDSEANRHNLLSTDAGSVLPHQAVRQLLGAEPESFFDRYQFAIRPATDDRPFFHQFFRWRTLPQIAAARGSGGLSLLESGYLVLVITLVMAVVSAAVLVLAPIVTLRPGSTHLRLRVMTYFGALGLGFLLLEVAFLQQLILVLHHPVYSAAVVIATFLVFAGLGSATAPLVLARWKERTVPRVVAGIVVLGALDLGLLALLGSRLAGAALPLQVGFAVAVVAPLALLMGMPFPLGLSALKATGKDLVPWAWAINGSASVVSPILATLVAVHWGFRVVVVAALAFYAIAGVWRLEARASTVLAD